MTGASVCIRRATLDDLLWAEAISDNLPTYKLHGHSVAYFGAANCV